MKILSIRMKNLASLAGEHFIDFESEPLASAGLVAIIGKTGAGKSTILDAMCLALFNRVPRLKDSDGKLVDVDGSELLTNSPQTVLRRGTGHGFAELSFVAQDQKVYSARWELKRARENPNGKLQSVQRSLKCLTDGNVVADKTKAVESQILRITQLSFEQFTRAVLLAQSEVTAFLKARDNERGELLEYLTNSSIFGKIGQLAFEKTKQIANQRKELENVLGHIEMLSDDEVAQYLAQFSAFDHDVKTLDTEKLSLQKQQQWFEQKQRLEENLKTHQQNLQVQKVQLDALTPEKQQLKQLEQFASIRPNLIQHKKLALELTQLQPKCVQAQQHFKTVDHQFNAEKTAFEQIDDQQKQQHQFEIEQHAQLETVRARVAERRVLVEQITTLKQESEQLQIQFQPLVDAENQLKNTLQKQVNQRRQYQAQLVDSAHFSTLDEGLSVHLKPLQRFIQSYQKFEQDYGEVEYAQTKLTEQRHQLNALQASFGQDDLLQQNMTKLRTERDQQLHKKNALDTLQQQWTNYQHLYAEHQQLNTAQSTLTSRLAESLTQLQHAEQAYTTQKNSLEQLQQMLQQQRLLHTENIEALRANLVMGEACLVCGSTEHPYAEKSAFSNELFQLQAQQEQQEIAKEKSAFEAWQHLQKLHSQHTATVDANSKQLSTLNAQLEVSHAQLMMRLTEFNIEFSEDHAVLNQNISTHFANIKSTQTQLDQTLAQYEQAQQNSYSLKNTIQQITEQLSVLQQAEQHIQHIVGLFNEAQQQAWALKPLSTTQQIFADLQQRQQLLKQLNELSAAHEQTGKQLDLASKDREFSEANIQKAKARIEVLMLEGKQNSDLAIQAIFTMTNKTVEKPHEWLKQFEQERQQRQTQFNQARQQFDQIRQTHERAKTALHECQTQQTQLQTQTQAVDDAIQQWLNENTNFNRTLLEQLSTISFEQEQQLKLRVENLERAFANAETAVKTVQEQLDQHLKHQPKITWEILTTQLLALNERIQQCSEQRDAIKLKLEVHKENVAKQKAFAEQIQAIQLEEHRWNKISSLMGDSTGKKFRDYAQQYNLDILLEYANQQLAMLSQRYTLKRLENSLSLAIVDHDMDGETRSVSSLSGGESFLTALALSLAIANMASGSMKIESLFIDEGFGTLDASSLHMVMNALDQLQSQGRKVVLISHIQEMHERIPVQIQVRPIGAGASRVDIVG